MIHCKSSVLPKQEPLRKSQKSQGLRSKRGGDSNLTKRGHRDSFPKRKAAVIKITIAKSSRHWPSWERRGGVKVYQGKNREKRTPNWLNSKNRRSSRRKQLASKKSRRRAKIEVDLRWIDSNSLNHNRLSEKGPKNLNRGQWEDSSRQGNKKVVDWVCFPELAPSYGKIVGGW